MTDTYAGGFLDGWAAAAETLRTRFDLIPRDATADPRINGERLGGSIRHSDPPEGKPGSWARILGHPKLTREALCVAQHAPGLTARQSTRLERLIDACDLLRPIGPDGKHGNRHTPWCGCDDVPSEPEGKPWLVGPQEPLRRLQWAEADSRGEAYIPAGRIRRLTEANLAALADCDPCKVHLIIGGACVHCGWEMR